MEASLERDDRRPSRVCARELDRVLDRLGARVEEGGFRLPGDRRGVDETLGEGDVHLVRDDREVRVHELRCLLGDRLDHPRVSVPDVEAADAAGEIEERVAVDVRERRSLAVVDHDRQEGGEGIGDDPVLAFEDLLGPWSRNRRPELDRLRGGHQCLAKGEGGLWRRVIAAQKPASRIAGRGTS